MSHQLSLTSLAARDSIRDKAPSIRERIYVLILRYSGPGRTRDEIAHDLGLQIQTVTPRVHELLAAGRIIETKEVRKTRSGRAAFVLRVMP